MPKYKSVQFPSKTSRKHIIPYGLIKWRSERRLEQNKHCFENSLPNGKDRVTCLNNVDGGSRSDIRNNDSDTNMEMEWLDSTKDAVSEPGSTQSTPWSIYYQSPSILDKENQSQDFDDSFNCDATEPYDISGRRVVDINHFIKELQNISNHTPFNCTLSDMIIVGERRSGFVSTLKLRCKMCGIFRKVSSELKNATAMDVNTAVVTSALCTGQGYAQVEEAAAVLNMPCMGKELFNNIQKNVQNAVHDVAFKEMEIAGREEMELAKAAGDVDNDGVPEITVVADGAWAKRSYRTNYNSLSGVASIVGKRTKKVLFIGVRNSYCSVCARAKNKSVDPKDHACSKNWNKSSTAMESDIIVEGFKCSMAMHGLKYKRLVGDGDSSVMSCLTTAAPYGVGCPVEKVECTNHLLRNYVNKLKDIAKKRTNVKGIVPLHARKAVKRYMKRLRSAVVGAVGHYSKDHSTPFWMKIKSCKEDLVNGPRHVLGDHRHCKAYFCKGQKENEICLVDELRHCGVWDDIMSAVNWLAHNAASLLEGMTNNLSECYNSYVAKFVGGKRVNFALRGSYTARCEAAVASHNTNYGLHSLVHKQLSKTSPGIFTKKFASRKQKNNDGKVRRKLLYSKKKITSKFCGPDKHYGGYQDAVELEAADDYSEEKMEEEKSNFLKNIEKTDQEIEEIFKNSVEQSSCPIWISERRVRLTSSNFGRIVKMKPTTKRSRTVQQLLYSAFKGTPATRYGVEKEPLARRDIEEVLSTTIEPSGLVICKEYPYLAASPDGLIGTDGVLEIKCPYNSADLTPIEAIQMKKVKFCTFEDGKLKLRENDDYYYQVQGQLHITERKYCIFVVWTPKGMAYCKIERNEEFWTKAIPKLKDFYFDSLLPELVNPRFTRGLPIREP